MHNISVSGADRGFYANAYPEKTIHHIDWNNIHIQARRGGILNYAENWTMKDVTLELNSPDTLELNHCKNIQLPDVSFTLDSTSNLEDRSIDQLLENWKKENPSVCIVPVNPLTKELIGEKDTASFSKSMHAYILNNSEYQVEYIEPLGDGFYFSPITISQKGNKIKVHGERDHEWTFYISSDQGVKEVQGVDNWKYDPEQNQIIAKKEGMQFEVVIE